MSIALHSAPRRRLWLGGWLSQAPAPADGVPPPAPAPVRENTAARLYDEVGEFLFAHDLPLAPDIFGVALAYLGGEDRELTLTIRERLRTEGRLDADFLRQLAEVRSGGIRPTTIARMADTLAAQLAQCLALLGESCTSATEYGDALDREVEQLDSPAGGGDAMSRLIDLTMQAVATSRQMAERLEEKRRETTRLRDNLDRARRAAEQDHLTGLINRRGFDARLQARKYAGEPADWCVAVCDIDDFKRINDRHGHDAGDRVLKLVARLLKTELAPDAIVARHGGEEFACLFAHADVDTTYAKLDAVRRSIAARSLINQDNGEPIGSLTISIGLAAVADDPVRAMRRADAALYGAKRDGKNRVAVAERGA
ncbi:GGDEF domain-containing protein [Sphingomonas sp. MA1305]|uniref:GGDEF domain-containing protein n=1 Tax=Sphingomonas sp. MA1305 TaxID=2479204 RepID=UPI0018DF3344|nr:GGDEF domain-containing protein [Sphingomonas sp. MA1305]MBI0474356.1 GGDEF domain-containing protein [Sphingomonas sp. MA1305]